MPTAGCSYRITLCTSSVLPPGSRVLVAARGPDGYTLPVCPLRVPSAGLPADVVHTSVAHTAADPGSLLTHLELTSEPSSEGEQHQQSRSLLPKRGRPGAADDAASSWRVRWVAVEELAPGSGAAANKSKRKPRPASDEEEDSGDSGGEEEATTGAAMRVFFFPVDKPVPRAPASAKQKISVPEISQGKLRESSDPVSLLYPLISSLLNAANSAIDEIAEAREAAYEAEQQVVAERAKARAALQQPPPPPPPQPQAPKQRAPLEPLPQAPVAPAASSKPAPLPMNPSVAVRAEFEAKWQEAALARSESWRARLQRRHLAACFRAWRDVASTSRALHVAWLRVAQRRVTRLGRATLTAWRDVAKAQTVASNAHDARAQLLVALRQDDDDDDGVAALMTPAQAHRALLARRRAQQLQMKRTRMFVSAWRDWAALKRKREAMCDAHRARWQTRRTRAVLHELRAYAARKRRNAALVDASIHRAKRRTTLRLLRAWSDTAAEEVHTRRMSQYIHVTDAAALLAAAQRQQHEHHDDASSELGVLRTALAAWTAAVRWRRRATFLVDRCTRRRQVDTQRSVFHAWAAQAAFGAATQKEWAHRNSEQSRVQLQQAITAWRALSAAAAHHNKVLLRASWAAWTDAIQEGRATAVAEVVASRAGQSAVASAFRAWRVAASGEIRDTLLRAASSAVTRRRLRAAFAEWRAQVDDNAAAQNVDDVAQRVRDALVRLGATSPIAVGGDQTPGGVSVDSIVASPADLRAAVATALRDTVYRRLGNFPPAAGEVE